MVVNSKDQITQTSFSSSASALSLLLFAVLRAYAQPQCGYAESISYPIDTSVFKLVQDFAAPSSRFQGRFHTGEDWYGGRDRSLGQPVRAAAAGRVTYSAPSGWGRDGGVVIIEHAFPDGAVAYSMYGHMMEGETVKFPPRLGCVQAGETIGLVGDARPAPHVHFEIRVNQPDIPGPGYSSEDPAALGWRDPAQFVTDWQAWLHPAHRWHVETQGAYSPPLELDDHSLMYLDGGTLKRATADGRVLWRIILDQPAVSVTGYEGAPLLTFADGTMQQVSYDGTLEERWSTGVALDSAPLDLGDGLLFHAPGDALAAFTTDRREVAWMLGDVPPFVRGHVTGQTIGLITADNELLTVSHTGQLLDRAALRSLASLGTLPDSGALLAYSRGGLWTIDEHGAWAFPFAWAGQLPRGGDVNAVLMDGLERVYLFDGQTLHAYSRDSSLCGGRRACDRRHGAAGEVWKHTTVDQRRRRDCAGRGRRAVQPAAPLQRPAGRTLAQPGRRRRAANRNSGADSRPGLGKVYAGVWIEDILYAEQITRDQGVG
jgi:murein DD-endopeptidase MepM/ murein hydrolase activator NlpD